MTKKLILLSCATAFLAVGCVVVPDEGYYDGRYEPRYDVHDDHRRYDNDRQRWEYQQGKNRVELERRKRELERREWEQKRQQQLTATILNKMLWQLLAEQRKRLSEQQRKQLEQKRKHQFEA